MSFDVTYPKRRYDEVSGIAPVRSQLVYPGHAIQTEPGFLQGRNTIIRNGQLVATVCGVVERVNKLVLVNPLKSRYLGDIGDVVVGRVEEIGNQRWFVDIGAGLRGQLSLNAINLPDSVQRRRTDEDMMEMRKYFVEGDVVSTEIQKWSSDTVQLHTRSAKYGKLQNGCLVKVTPQLVRRQQLHFIKLACGVSIVLGCNGQIWVGLPNRDSHLDTLNYAMSSAEYENVPIEKRKEIARVRNCIAALGKLYMDVTPASIEQMYEASVSLELDPKDLLSASQVVAVARKARLLEREEETSSKRRQQRA